MSSYYVCDCEQRIPKNLFAGNKVQLLINETAFEQQVEPAHLSSILLGQALTVLCCPSCQRLHIVDEKDENKSRTYMIQLPS
jgi:regulator of RNase E activity RraA